MKEIHLSNAAIAAIPEYRHLFGMWEDNDIAGHDDAIGLARWIDVQAPGAFVLVTTGDYIRPPCCQDLGNHSGVCDTYDAHYNVYLVAASVFEKHAEVIMAADKEWREKTNECHYEERQKEAVMLPW